MIRRSLPSAILLFLAAALGIAQSTSEDPLTLQELEKIALERNPTLVQATAQVEAAGGRAKQAGLMPKPVLGYFAEEWAFRAGTGRGKQGVFVEQTIPLGGKLSSSRSIFEKEGLEAEASLEAQRLRVLNSVRSLYHEAVVAARRVHVRERLALLGEEAVRVSGQLYNTGAADRPDVLESEIEAREMRLALEAAKDQQYHTWVSLATMIGQPDMKLRPLAGETEASPPELDRQAAIAALLEESPQLKRAKAQAERAAAVVDRADKERIPDLFFRFGADYDRERVETPSGAPGQPVGWEGAVSAGFSLPLFNRNQGDRAAARADLSRARAEVQRVELALRSRLSGVFEAYLKALRRVDEYGKEILPRAEQAYRLYLDKFQQMGAAYPQVLIAQRTLFQTSERYLSALEQANVAAVQIQGMLLVDGLDAPPLPGEVTMGLSGSEIPGAVRSGELPVSVESPGQE
jgi:cobalt-zinc-cadmium efflux system outer membrane protein